MVLYPSSLYSNAGNKGKPWLRYWSNLHRYWNKKKGIYNRSLSTAWPTKPCYGTCRLTKVRWICVSGCNVTFLAQDIFYFCLVNKISKQRIWLDSRLLCHVLSTWSWCKQGWPRSGHHSDERRRSLLVTIWYLLERVSKLKFCLHSRVLINHPLRQWSQVNCTTAKSLLPWRRR